MAHAVHRGELSLELEYLCSSETKKDIGVDDFVEQSFFRLAMASVRAERSLFRSWFCQHAANNVAQGVWRKTLNQRITASPFPLHTTQRTPLLSYPMYT